MAPAGRRQITLYEACVAFFHAVMDEWLCVVPPAGLRRPGRVWQLRKAVYGTRPASRLWQAFVSDVFEKSHPPWTRVSRRQGQGSQAHRLSRPLVQRSSSSVCPCRWV